MKIAVIGTSGSGKSTFAKDAASILRVSYIEQDKLFWLPNWTPRSKDDFKSLLEPKIAEKSWTICGNHSAFQKEILRSATHIVWLDYKIHIIYFRAIKRTLRRVFLKEECCNGNIETFRHAFMSKDSILWWIFKTYRKRKEDYNKMFENKPDTGTVHIRFKNPVEANEWLMSLKSL
jgi:adenylate kinase family enzyme